MHDSSVEALLFDLDDTLCSYRRSGEEVLASAFETMGIDPLFEIDDYYEIFDNFAEESDSGLENRERCFGGRSRREHQ